MTRKLPIKHIIGYVTSVALTFAAAWAALGSNLSVTWILISIFALAIIQAAIQLFLFMHLTESGIGNTPWNMMFHGAVIAAILVAGSLFVMSFGF
ncbi:cytochrome C oxidase subunit IV family protein [Virgibacillus doumboii]|uniref:cytochrome C oxidase subunit IV family protein n=1 Tax=Virgibacillus doumboii TaxID=2697503 RepID=UPI0013E06958|nr:cytochrome C oxidase subunit IV family protein [Virgibacillus doumboii]